MVLLQTIGNEYSFEVFVVLKRDFVSPATLKLKQNDLYISVEFS